MAISKSGETARMGGRVENTTAPEGREHLSISSVNDAPTPAYSLVSAEPLDDTIPVHLQQFIPCGECDIEAVGDDLRTCVAEQLAHLEAALIVDERAS